MSLNKYAVTRYHILDRCFSNFGRRFFIGDLLEAINEVLREIDPKSKGIKVRQLYDDIRYMQSAEGYDAPIEKYLFEGKKYYRYSNVQYSINKSVLKENEISQIKSAIEIISRFKGMPQFEWINELAPKLQQAFTLDKDHPVVISFDSNIYLKGVENIGELFHSILNERVLCISYNSFKANSAKEYTMHPYYLKQYNNRWFIFGLNEEDKRLTHLALDRIEAMFEKSIRFIPNTKYDFDEIFEDIIGVSNYNRSKTELVTIEVMDNAAPYILSKPLHGSQRVVQKQPLIITIEVKLNKELESLLLSFGERVKVISPNALQREIRERLSHAKANY